MESNTILIIFWAFVLTTFILKGIYSIWNKKFKKENETIFNIMGIFYFLVIFIIITSIIFYIKINKKSHLIKIPIYELNK